MPGQKNIILQRNLDKKTVVKTIENLNENLQNGDILFINSSENTVSGAVEVSGSHKYTGLYPLDKYETIQSIYIYSQSSIQIHYLLCIIWFLLKILFKLIEF